MQKTQQRGHSRRGPGGYVVLEPDGGAGKNREFKLGYSDLDRLKAYLNRYAITFGLFQDNTFQDRLFPFGTVPRVIGPWEFDTLEKGLRQRVHALNLFLHDIYHERKVLRDKIVPEEFVFSCPAYLPEVYGVRPPAGVYAHLSGIDLVQAADGTWFILEDNLRVPSGASYPLIAREAYHTVCPGLISGMPVRESRDYPNMLGRVMDDVNPGGISVVLSPGRFNAAFFEHSYLAEKMGVPLVFGNDLEVDGEFVYFKDVGGHRERVGAVYRRLSDEYLDPMVFEPDSIIGVPNLMSVYRKGNVAVINAVGNGIADDKGIYYFVPALIKYYLGEEAILRNAPTYLPFFERDRKHVLQNLHRLVIKDVAEAGGYGVVFGSRLSADKRRLLADAIRTEPRRFIGQEVVEFRSLQVFDQHRVVRRRADLRAYVLHGKDISVWPSGLTRYAMDRGSMIVNSSQGGGFKDTWVLSL